LTGILPLNVWYEAGDYHIESTPSYGIYFETLCPNPLFDPLDLDQLSSEEVVSLADSLQDGEISARGQRRRIMPPKGGLKRKNSLPPQPSRKNSSEAPDAQERDQLDFRNDAELDFDKVIVFAWDEEEPTRFWVSF
jgi:hypothetical protein